MLSEECARLRPRFQFFQQTKTVCYSIHLLNHGEAVWWFGDGAMLRLEHSPPSHVFKYRDRVTIIIDILNSIRRSRQGKKKTQIMQSANLNYGQMKRYLNYLTNQGFLEVNGRRTYVLTSKGSEFLSVGETQNINSVT